MTYRPYRRPRRVCLGCLALGVAVPFFPGCAGRSRHADSFASSASVAPVVVEVTHRQESPVAGEAAGATAAAVAKARSNPRAPEPIQADSGPQLTPVAFRAQEQPPAMEAAEEALPQPGAVQGVELEDLAAPAGSPAPDLAADADGRTPRDAFLELDALTSENPEGVTLMDVANSVHNFFPLVEAAYLERNRTAGDQIAAWGAFDTKLKASTENQPLGFYETYRHGAGIAQPLYGGGEVFGGYRVGRGVFEPWYLERQTNEGGEFKAGFLVPLARNREIDARRAELWRATYDRQIAEPEIRFQLIGFVLEASVAYWEWIAASQSYEIGEAALAIVLERNEGLEVQVETGNIDPPVLQDNLRAIAEREAKLAERRRKLQQSAYKLSLFLRGSDGEPVLPPTESLPTFPPVEPIDLDQVEGLLSEAVSRRPELESLAAQLERTRVDLAEASNDLLPNVDAGVVGAQDMGEPTSSKRDKSEFELELGLFVDVPVQRRKGFGKIQSTRAKLGQLEAKQRFTADKIVAEVQVAVAALDASYQQYQQTLEAIELAEELARIERRRFSLGESDLLAVFLREQFAIEAADNLVLALLSYHVARSELVAALGYQWPDASR